MAALMPEVAGALLLTDAEDKPRVRVRLHFGGTFAQDGPRQWRYVGGEVYNESFPLDSKYAEVMKRLNDKFGDTVSFKYLCPGDDIDPDNLVQVQGDDDLREMCDEYQNALQKPSTPVKTVRIKVFVFRAVIFEREVQELDEELGEDDELMDLPDDGLVGEPLSSCDQAECGPNWSDWGEPDEHEATQSSIPSAQFSSDNEHHTSTAASAAAAAATAALYNISMSVHNIASGRTHVNMIPAPLTSAGALGGTGGNAPVFAAAQEPRGVLAHMAPQQKRASTGGNGVATGEPGVVGGGGGYIGGSRPPYGDSEAQAAAAGKGLAVSHRDVSLGTQFGTYVPSDMAVLLDPGYPEESCEAGGGYMGTDAEQLDYSDEQLYDEAAEADVVKEAAAGAEGKAEGPGHGVWAGDQGPWRYGSGDEAPQRGQQQSLREERTTAGMKWTLEEQGERQHRVQGDWRHDLERGLPLSRLEQQQTQQAQERQQEQQHTLDYEQQQTQQAQEKQNLNQNYQNVLQPTGLGFYCYDDLEDPYGEPYDNTLGNGMAATGAGLIRLLHLHDPAVFAGGGGFRNRSSAASDGVVRAGPRVADMAAYGEHPSGHCDAAPTAAGGLLGRLPAAADMLPRHISAFGESSRDDSHGGGGVGSGPLLPSRITIFGDDKSLHGTPGGAGSHAGGGGRQSVAAGGLHRLAVLGAAGDAALLPPWADRQAASGDATAVGGGGKSSAAGLLGPAEDLVAGDSRLCITQEFGTKARSSMLDLGEHGGGLEDATGDGSGGGVGGVLPLDMLDPLSRTGLGGLGGDGLNALGSGANHSHPLRGVVKKRKSEVSILAKIGEGAFGEVSQAQVFPYGIVAIKWLKRERFAKYSESFQREAETLAKLNHPNIIRMYGLVMDSPDTPNFPSDRATSSGGAGAGAAHAAPQGGGPGGSGGSGGNNNGPGNSGAGTPTGLIGGIITEFVRNGSLGQYLRSLNGRRLSLRQRAMIALQASLGMAYLHEQSPAVVHFDLKPDNLLVDGEGDSMVIKVADFGLSKHKLSNYVSCRDLRGTLPYMASELVTGNGQISEKVDVYSMGVVMWEMYTGEVPFSHLTAHDILSGLMHGSLHLNLPSACEPEWRSLVETCMDQNPANRPSFQELAMQLQEILRLERQSSNASSVSAAAAAAAAAAVLDSDSTAAPPTPSPPVDGSGGGGAGQVRSPVLAVPMPMPQGTGAPQAQPQVQSPGPVPPLPPPPPPLQAPQALLARQKQQLQAAAAAAAAAQQQQHHPLSPPLQQQLQPAHAPLLAQLQQQHPPPPPPGPQQQHAPPPPPFQLQQQFGAVPYVLPQQVMRQPVPVPPPLPQQAPHPPPTQPPPPPAPQHLHYLQQLSPGLLLQHQQQLQQQQAVQQQQQQNPSVPPPPAHLYAHLQLRPPALFPQPQQPAQHMNGLYGLAGGMGVGGAGLLPLVSWGDCGL